MDFVINGDTYHLDREMVVARLRGRSPEPIQTHWVDVGSTRLRGRVHPPAGHGPGLHLYGAVMGGGRRDDQRRLA
jgi:hypothetical protein